MIKTLLMRMKNRFVTTFLVGKSLCIRKKPLNVITFGQTGVDNINQMITITDYFNLVTFLIGTFNVINHIK